MSDSELASWTPLWVLLGLYVLSAGALALAGRRRASGDVLAWIPAGIERVTGVPGWAGAMMATSWFGLLFAGIGFYNDVAWHIGLGRDKELFTPPHTMIVIGLGFIALAAGIGVLFATMARVETGVRVGGLRIPWSAIPLGLLGLTALSGFPLDELWHRQYGVDVTMWSPTHLLMIVGASLSPLAGWLALGEAGVRPGDGRWARILHVAVAWLVLAGLSSVQGEFDFGVPQFQQLYLPVLIALAAAFTFVAARLVLGPGWVLLIGVLALAVRLGDRGEAGDVGVTTRSAALYIGSAVLVEVVAWLAGTRRPMRFAILAGLAVATGGLATEWAWNSNAHQPWNSSLLPEAVLVGAIAAVGAGVLGLAFAGGVLGRPVGVGAAALVAAGAAVLASLVIPLPRNVGDVTGDLTLERRGDEAVVDVRLEPRDAADDARWFQVSAWQGGGLELAEMEEVAPGHYRSDRPVPVTGDWKTLVRLHRGDEMMTVPVYLPADPEIDEPEVPAVDRRMPFESETEYLLRETEPGNALFARVVFGLLAGIVAAWVTAFAVAVARLADGGRVPGRRRTTAKAEVAQPA